MGKVYDSTAEAVADMADGATIAVGGFGLCGIPSALIAALQAGRHDGPAGRVEQLRRRRLGPRRAAAPPDGSPAMIASYVGENKEFERQYLSGELEVELIPQGTLAERLRAGGAGIPAFYTPTGVGHAGRRGRPALALRRRRHRGRRLARRRRSREFDGRRLRARGGDPTRLRAGAGEARRPLRQPRLPHGDARTSTRCAPWPAEVTIAEVEELVEPGELDPDHVHLPGIFVQRVVEVGATEKRIERRTVRARPGEHA